MRVFRHFENVVPEARRAVVAVGNFDGVHRGHQAVIGEARRTARKLGAPHAVLTFEPHPRSVFQPDAPPFRLTPLRMKAHCIEALGVDFLFVVHFDLEFSKLTAEAFVHRALIEGLHARHVVAGYDFVFGHGRRGNAKLLAAMAPGLGLGFTAVPPVRAPSGGVYSSTQIRDALVEGRPARAAELLGRCWEIEGRVVRGADRGEALGFPTANVRLDDYLRPARGVYAVRAGVDLGRETVWREGVANFGRRPTFPGEGEFLEVHLFDYSGELYGAHLRIALIDFLRPERKFEGADALVAQIAEDCRRARGILAETRATFRPADVPSPVAGAA
jgi:riboflavin kinase/FMN adenylyltransferase